MSKLYPTIFEHFGQYALLDRAKDMHVTYNTLLKTAKGNYQWYFHQLTVLACDNKGFPRYGLKLLSNIQDYKTDTTLNFNIYLKTMGAQQLIYSKDYLPHEINNSLSPREIEIVELIKEGFSTKMIADKLCISENTVSTHRKNIIRKSKS